MLSFVFPVCVFQLCWLCSFVASTIAAEDLLQGAVATSRGRGGVNVSIRRREEANVRKRFSHEVAIKMEETGRIN